MPAQVTNFDDLVPGQVVTLILHSAKRPDTDITTRFMGFSEENDLHRATFREDGDVFIWNIRHVRNRWVYGTSDDEYASIAKVLEEGKDYMYDKHLDKLRTRASHRGIKVS